MATANGSLQSDQEIELLIPYMVMAVWASLQVVSVVRPTPTVASIANVLSLVAVIIFGILHGRRRFGLRGVTAVFGIAVIVSNVFESLSIATGFPFGFYYHTAAMGPKIGQVPLVVGPGYFATCYPAFVLADGLMGRAGEYYDRLWRHGVPVVAAFFATAWDLSIDPLGSTVSHLWVYPGGGSLFGVPLSNFAGWYLTTWIIFEMSTLCLSRRFVEVRPVDAGHWDAVCVLWGLTALKYPLVLLCTPDVIVTDGSGSRWRAQDIAQVSALNGMVNLVATAVIVALVVRSRSGATIRE